MSEWIEHTGIAAFTMLMITVFLGLDRWKLHWFNIPPKYHFYAGILTVLAALAHVGLIVYVELAM